MSRDEYGFEPSLLLVTDNHRAEARGQAAASAVGARVREVLRPDAAAAWLDEYGPVDAVLIVLDSEPAALATLLERIDRAYCLDGTRGTVAVPLAMIDALSAKVLLGSAIDIVADPDAHELLVSLARALALARTSPALLDRDNEPHRLRQLSEEVSRIARTLAELTGAAGGHDPYRADPPGTDEPGPDISAATVRASIRARRLRDQFFDSQLFADPAWDMLLDLMAARLEKRQVAVSSLCIAAAVPATTALRWIRALVDEGLFVRVADPRDGRRVFIELSEPAAAGVQAYFNALGRNGFVPV